MSKVSDADVEAALARMNLTRISSRKVSKDEMRAALEAVSSIHEAKPVAWRWRETAEDTWIVTATPPNPAGDGYIVEPLYAHPAPISKGVTVESLEWIEADHSLGRLWRANCIMGTFRVKENGSWSGPRDAIGPWIMAGGVDEAKATAETYYRTMVLSTLSHTAREIEAGGEIAEPTRYDMVKMTGSAMLLPAVRDDGEWVKYADVEAADKRIAELREALKPFAAEADTWHPEQADAVAIYTSKVESPEGDSPSFTIADFRRARAALEPRQ